MAVRSQVIYLACRLSTWADLAIKLKIKVEAASWRSSTLFNRVPPFAHVDFDPLSLFSLSRKSSLEFAS